MSASRASVYKGGCWTEVWGIYELLLAIERAISQLLSELESEAAPPKLIPGSNVRIWTRAEVGANVIWVPPGHRSRYH